MTNALLHCSRLPQIPLFAAEYEKALGAMLALGDELTACGTGGIGIDSGKYLLEQTQCQHALYGRIG
ncbi:hypothetical protein KBZ18_14560 [Synechococcus sp. Cruz-9H2]|uniref:hypothetical protein n=1 Tax=unclassified Synechococcus TaxID=2626047 RepID=UPI0020CD794F|nr:MULTISPECIES: hypothetical protein [unclassified Synechococcus]MCP9820704.1 hypothetical protein [Synechococcus sp. Cruz-9H2]MCP9844910.1 hypothetical protein [Synechococcus sp. Edmonson 11F2]MCP9857031.1 hypothetical protein [Synechococcus sp. Cruz-9C9]MCP9864346.1 hypothetical protein [Synechococcus sp. Cruz-7E5]MCP9871614.1 hypothetical protein [Synechococcus sp. Cruz-7B9]